MMLRFSSLQIPAITLCNSNPLRMSAIHLASPALQKLIKEYDPSLLREQLHNHTSVVFNNNTSNGNDSTHHKKNRDMIHPAPPFDGGGALVRAAEADWVNRMFNDYFIKHPLNSDGDSTDGKDPAAMVYYKMIKYFTYLYSLHNITTRFEMGHQLDRMLVECSFMGRGCYQRNFKYIDSLIYGNCFTLENETYIVKQSGPMHGLEILVYLETDEYIPMVTNSFGLQLLIHGPHTFPFPSDEGFAIMAGTHTYLGLRQLTVNRATYPYGDCVTGTEVLAKKKMRYTRKTCQMLCLQRKIRKNCGCYDGTHTKLNKILSIPATLRVCHTEKDLDCVTTTKFSFEEHSATCDCRSPCNEMQYRTSISSREWPSADFARLISDVKCMHENDLRLCHVLANKTDSEMAREFLKITIYYEDLNHDVVQETPTYEKSQFVSDIGGAIGLWSGLSVLSICELLHFLSILIYYIWRVAQIIK